MPRAVIPARFIPVLPVQRAAAAQVQIVAVAKAVGDEISAVAPALETVNEALADLDTRVSALEVPP